MKINCYNLKSCSNELRSFFYFPATSSGFFLAILILIILLCIIKVKATVAPPPAIAPAAPENIEMGVLNLAANAGFEPVDLQA